VHTTRSDAAGPILSIWAHPDDESYLAAGLMAQAAAAGRRVVVVTATRGEGGGDPRQRTRELRAALAVLGVHEHVVLDLPDGGCDTVPAELAVRRLRMLWTFVRPATILTFGPDGITGHRDHIAVAEWVHAAWLATGARARLLQAAVTPEFAQEHAEVHDRFSVFEPGFPVTTPRERLAIDVDLPPALLDRKRAALAAHASQTAGLAAAMGESTYRRWIARETFVEVPVREPAGAARR